MKRLIGALVMLGSMLTLNAYAEEGKASWYGEPYHGRRAANGTIYNMYEMTGAHKTLPLNSKVRVTNTRNGKSVVLKITDRGPFVEGRIVDVSLVAAQKLDMLKAGVVPCRVDVIELGDNKYHR